MSSNAVEVISKYAFSMTAEQRTSFAAQLHMLGCRLIDAHSSACSPRNNNNQLLLRPFSYTCEGRHHVYLLIPVETNPVWLCVCADTVRGTKIGRWRERTCMALDWVESSTGQHTFMLITILLPDALVTLTWGSRLPSFEAQKCTNLAPISRPAYNAPPCTHVNCNRWYSVF